jgi:hypothetical protein
LNHIPPGEEIEVQIMEFGDLSSLAVEYPDYNSLGRVLHTLTKVAMTEITNRAIKVSQTHDLPKELKTFSDLAGRALIVT